MKRTHDPSYFTALFVKAGLIAALATVLLAPTTVKVHSSEAALKSEHASPIVKRASWDALPLPPIPYLETMPWLARQRAPTGMKVDMLLGPGHAPHLFSEAKWWLA